MERGEEDEERRHLGGSGAVLRRGGGGTWPTVDGPLGVSEEDAVAYARSFFRWGFCLLPWLWAVNCLYFWPVLRAAPASSPPYFARIRPYVVRSAIGFVIFTLLLASWALTFAIGGEGLFGPAWKDFVVYNLADKWGLTGWY